MRVLSLFTCVLIVDFARVTSGRERGGWTLSGEPPHLLLITGNTGVQNYHKTSAVKSTKNVFLCFKNENEELK